LDVGEGELRSRGRNGVEQLIVDADHPVVYAVDIRRVHIPLGLGLLPPGLRELQLVAQQAAGRGLPFQLPANVLQLCHATTSP